jgi:ATP-dependent RNA helicase DDX47/RRP3
VFTRTCDATRKIALTLRNLGFGSVPIHGQMSQPKRLGALNKFKSGERAILVATDVASRGLDIPSVDVVINYDVPGNSKDYVHRVGRTARAGRSGRSVTLVTQYDVEVFQRIEGLTGVKMEAFPAERDEVLLLLEQVNNASRIATMQMKESDDKGGGRGGGGGRKRGHGHGGDDEDDGSLAGHALKGGGGGFGGRSSGGGGGGGKRGRGGGGKRGR